MTNKEILQQLKKFQITGTKGEIFKTHKYVLSWIDKVAPLLKYSNEHYSTFMNAANKVMVPGISSQIGIPCLNIMKSTVSRAIIELENDITETKPTFKSFKKKENKRSSHWYQKPQGIIILAVASGLIIYTIKLLIAHFFITPS